MIKSQITLKQLEAFVQVVDTGSFRKAAAALGTTQPNVSARIAALEKTLDVVLMHRDAGSVRLTPDGDTLVAAAREVLHAGEAFLEAAKRRDLVSERLRLGVSELVACTWLHDFLRAFKAEYPGLRVELQVDLSREIDRALSAGQLDLALQTAPFATDPGGSVPLGTTPYIWVATPELTAAVGQSPDLEQLFQHPILTHARHSQATTELLAEANRHALSLDQVIISNSLASCPPMAVDGMAVALLPEPIVRGDIDHGRLARVPCRWTPSPLDLFARFHNARAPRYVRHGARLAARIAGISP